MKKTIYLLKISQDYMKAQESSFKVTDNTFESLKRACENAGTNLSEVCREAGVNRSTIERWKEDEPKTIVIIRKMLRIVDKKHKARSLAR